MIVSPPPRREDAVDAVARIGEDVFDLPVAQPLEDEVADRLAHVSSSSLLIGVTAGAFGALGAPPLPSPIEPLQSYPALYGRITNPESDDRRCYRVRSCRSATTRSHLTAGTGAGSGRLDPGRSPSSTRSRWRSQIRGAVRRVASTRSVIVQKRTTMS